MRVKFAAGAYALLGISSLCIAQPPQPQATQSSTATQQSPLQVEDSLMAAKLVYMAPPIYPQIAVMAHVSGVVTLDTIVTRNGTVSGLRYISGPALLRQAAMNAARQWRFDPTLLNGQPVEVETTISVPFNLYDTAPFTFKMDVRDLQSSHTMLNETIEVSGIGNKKDWTSFIAAFGELTSRAWLAAIPASARDKKSKVTVSFTLNADGSIDGGVPLMHSSGDAVIDSAARLAIRDSAPFRNVPPNGASLNATVRVTYAYDHPQATTAPAGASQ